MCFTILYGTQTGNAERLAFRIARLALKRGASEVHCLPADECPMEQWIASKGPLLFVCSNANQGEAPDTIRRTWFDLLSSDAPPLVGLSYAVFGLGDSLYAKFNYMAKMLHNRLKQLGASPLVLRGLGDESDAKGLDEVLLPWLMELWEAIGWITQTERVTLKQEDPLAAPFFPLFFVSLRDHDALHVHGADDHTCGRSKVMTAFPPRREATWIGEVHVNRRLTAPDHFQAVHHLVLHTNERDEGSLQYETGDALGIYCSNRPELVDTLLHRMGYVGEEMLLVEPNGSHGLTVQTAQPFFGIEMTLRYFLTHYVDLDAVTTQEFFWMLAQFVEVTGLGPTDAEEVQEVKARLMEFADPTQVNEFLTYAHREKRNVCEVLYDFKTIHPPLDVLLSFMTWMRPRLFSISSALEMDGPSVVHLTVAQLEWTTPLKRHRTGLCSTKLVNAPIGTKIQCFVWKGALAPPLQPCALLCIATGTGVAPIRSLIRSCAAGAIPGWKDVPICLVFGCRNESKDYLYAEEWEQLRAGGRLPQLTVLPAFSRDTAKKVYVQHQLGQHARLVGSFLTKAVVYVCGNAKQMPKDVHSALTSIMEACVCSGDVEEAQVAMKQLAREGRYQVDTWSA